MLVLLSVLWGGSFFFIRIAVTDLPPLTIVLLRVGLAALALNAFLCLRGARLPRPGRLWVYFLGMGFLNNAIPFSLIVWGETHIGSGLASILNATTPFFTAIVANALTDDEKLSRHKLAGLAVGFAGVVIMIGPAALKGVGTHLMAQLAILGAALSYAFAGVFGRRFARLGVSPMVTAAGQVTASSFLLLPVAVFFDPPWSLTNPPLTVWAAILGLGLLSSAVAYILYFRILAAAGATNIVLVTLLIPVTAVLLGILFLGEHIGLKEAAGMACILLGLAAIDGRLMKLRRKRTRLRQRQLNAGPGRVEP